MKLIVQIPCYDEESTLAGTLADIPRAILGVDEVELLVVDDGSTDGTVNVALDAGADHVVRHAGNRGLAAAFCTGMDACLRLEADIIVNTDADNQYCGADIPKLIAPILDGRAEIVVGDRRTWRIRHFSLLKRVLQAVGSWVVRRLSGTRVADAASGFRAYSREAAIRLTIVSSFSHCMETIVQAGNRGMSVVSVPIRTNAPTRGSRLFGSILGYVGRSAATIARTFLMYHPLRVFVWLSLLLMLAGAVPIVRFLYLFFLGEGSGHVQSLVLGGVLWLTGFLTLMVGLVADLIAYNRQLIEVTLEKVKRIELGEGMQSSPSPAEQTVEFEEVTS